ncbi:hypothetical protein BG004_005588 [Podila humilis]|nr:hypothetical protein BG004_005588 [Podila humilis]
MTTAPPFRQGSIFYNLDTPNPAQQQQQQQQQQPAPTPSILEPHSSKTPISLLVSPPPSPSRNAIFNQSWSASTGPNVSSLRPRSDSTTSAASSSSLTSDPLPPPRVSPRLDAADTSYSAKFYHHSNNSSQNNIRSPNKVVSHDSDIAASSSNGPSDATRDFRKSLQRPSVRGSTLSPTLHNTSPSRTRALSPVRIPRPLALPSPISPSIVASTASDGSMPLSPMEHLAPKQATRIFSSTCGDILPPCQVTIDHSKTGQLGHGRHAEVYKALVQPIQRESLTCRDLFNTVSTEKPITAAAKCLFSDAQSIEAGYEESAIFRHLQLFNSTLHPGRQFVVGYVGLHDMSASNDEANSSLDQSHVDEKEKEKELCLLLEYCAQGTIWDWIRHQPEQVGLAQWLIWTRQLLLAVSYIHEAGLIHHDIKPHNILLTEDLEVRLSDFGGGLFLTPVARQEGLNISQALGRGTQPYSAPELFASANSHSTYGQGIDIYSLGVTLYVIGLTAQEPFHKMKSMLEMVVWIKKGGFWLWEDQGWVHDRGPIPKELGQLRHSTSPHLSQSPSQRLSPVGTLERSVSRSVSRSNSFRSPKQAQVGGTPAVLLSPINTRLFNEDSRHLAVKGFHDDVTSPEKSQSGTPVSPRSVLFTDPLTPRSASSRMEDRERERRSSGETMMRFLNGEVVPPCIIQLLKEMCHPDPQRRPTAKQLIEQLDRIEAEIELEQHQEQEQEQGQELEEQK